MALVAVVLALVAAGGCAADKKRIEQEERLSASRLSGKFHHDDPLVAMLSPAEREALHNQGMLEPGPDGELVASKEDGEGEEGDGDAPKSLTDQAGEVMMSVLSVSVTLGMIAAPYLLF